MTNKEKQLLLQDLCARLPYGVKVKLLCRGPEPKFDDWIEATLNTRDIEHFGKTFKNIKPYLRPMSSMTGGEKKELLTLLVGKDAIGYFQVENDGITNTDENTQFGPNWQYHWLNFSNENISLYVDWLNSHHFDYRGLIEKGLALEAPEGMYQ